MRNRLTALTTITCLLAVGATPAIANASTQLATLKMQAPSRAYPGQLGGFTVKIPRAGKRSTVKVPRGQISQYVYKNGTLYLGVIATDKHQLATALNTLDGGAWQAVADTYAAFGATPIQDGKVTYPGYPHSDAIYFRVPFVLHHIQKSASVAVGSSNGDLVFDVWVSATSLGQPFATASDTTLEFGAPGYGI